jgi:Transglycosylase SLT domain
MSDALSGLTGAYGNGLLQQDPAYMPAMQRLALARSLIGQGISDAPARPTQGLSRIAAALLGSYEMNQGNQGVQDTMRQRTQDAMSAYNTSMSPLAGAMLGTPPPAPATPPGGGGMPASPPASSASPTIQAAPPPAQSAAGPSLAPIVHQLESSGSAAPGIRGDGGAAAGPMQVHQAALTDVNRAQGTNYTLDQLAADPQLGQKVGDMYLTLQQQRFPGRPDLALAAYNAGPTATANAGGPGVPGVPPAAAPYVAKGEAMLGDGGQPAAPAPAAPGAAPQTGLNNPNIMRAFQMHQAALKMVLADPYNMQTRQLAQGLEQTSSMLMGMDTTTVDPVTGLQTSNRTGAQSSAATPLAHYQKTSPGVYTDTSGTHAPTFEPAGRVTFNPATGQGYQSQPGGAVPLPPPAMGDVAGLKAAQAQGTATGQQAVATVGKMTDIGREADTAIGNIDYGVNQLHQAAAGGIPSGYFAPWLATAAAAGKSLGIDMKSLGVDPQAVGNVQSAQKTLGVVAGNILQNAIGKDSAITDAKIDHFIHTQPGIETDPQALERVLGWARSQFVFNHNMAMDAMSSADPQTGMLPLGWQAGYYKKAGAFAPIYDPLSQEMKQPTGEGPAAGLPAAPTPTAPTPPSRADIEAEIRRRGLKVPQ